MFIQPLTFKKQVLNIYLELRYILHQLCYPLNFSYSAYLIHYKCDISNSLNCKYYSVNIEPNIFPIVFIMPFENTVTLSDK